jgi:pyruvate carboxylase subunit B
MMRDSGVLDRYPEVIRAMSEVVVKGGFGTSVTPVSQFYFQQAYNNVMLGPWKKIADGYGKMVLGYFGKTPVSADAEIIKIASEQLKLLPTSASPLELNDANPGRGIEPARKKLIDARLPVTDENIFIAATCQDKGLAWLKGEARVAVRKNAQKPQAVAAKTSATAEENLQKSRAYNVSLENQEFSVYFEGNKAVVNGRTYSVDVAEIAHEIGAAPAKAVVTASLRAVNSPLPGLLMRINCRVGDVVGDQDTLFVVEAMKMETEIKAPVAGKITRIAVEQGAQLTAGQAVIYIG